MVKVDSEEFLNPLKEHLGSKNFFIVCNPPFFACVDSEKVPKKKMKTNESESFFENGGEVGFVARLMDESLTFNGFQFGSALIGQKSSLRSLMKQSKESGIEHTKTVQMFQGRTVRWAFLWSRKINLNNVIGSNKNQKEKWRIQFVKKFENIFKCFSCIEDLLRQLQVLFYLQ